MWQCPDCHEEHGKQFDACWQCGFQREVAEAPAPSAETPSAPPPASKTDLNDRNSRLRRRLAFVAALLVLAIVEYSLLLGGLETATVAELALIAVAGCIGIYLLFRHSCFRRFQYRLRTLLLTVLLVSLGISWFALRMHEARKQKEAVNAIVQAGGSAMYSYEKSNVPAPAWRQRLFQNDLFSHVEGLLIVSDATSEYLELLDETEQLRLSGDGVSNDAMEHLKGLGQLQLLSVTNTRVTDRGLEHVKGLARLRRLMLHNIAFTDVGMKHLEEGLPQLEWLYLTSTQVTDTGLKHLQGLTQLQALALSGKQITDNGLMHVGGLAQVHLLDLKGTQVTDAGLEHLRHMGQLRLLDLRDTHVTDDGVERLKAVLPTCRIQH